MFILQKMHTLQKSRLSDDPYHSTLTLWPVNAFFKCTDQFASYTLMSRN
jgi:hypothetical protein